VILDKEGGVETARAIVDYKTSTSADADHALQIQVHTDAGRRRYLRRCDPDSRGDDQGRRRPDTRTRGIQLRFSRLGCDRADLGVLLESRLESSSFCGPRAFDVTASSYA